MGCLSPTTAELIAVLLMPHIAKWLEASIVDGKLNEDLIHCVWEHMPVDPASSTKIHEPLVSVQTAHKGPLNPIFLDALGRLAPCLINKDQLKYWFKLVIGPAVESAGDSNKVVALSREFINQVLDGNHDDELKSVYRENARMYLRWLVDIYVGDSNEWIPTPTGPGCDERKRFTKANTRALIIAHGARELEETLMVVQTKIMEPKYRVEALQLLSQLASQHYTGKLFKFANTPILESLLLCIEHDNSSTAVQIAATTLAMVIPHVTDRLVALLPRLLACYGRLASWLPALPETALDPAPPSDSSTPKPEASTDKEKDGEKSKSKWAVLSPLGREDAPTVTPLFSFLYGLFPNNTLHFTSQADEYLSKKDYKRPFSGPWDRFLILKKTEDLMPQFTLHPLLITSDSEQELANAPIRFQNLKSAVGITMMCSDLWVSSQDNPSDTVETATSAGMSIGSDAHDDAEKSFDAPSTHTASTNAASANAANTVTPLLQQHRQLFLASMENVAGSSVLADPRPERSRSTSTSGRTSRSRRGSVNGSFSSSRPSSLRAVSPHPSVVGLPEVMEFPQLSETTTASSISSGGQVNTLAVAGDRGRTTTRTRSTSATKSLRMSLSRSPPPSGGALVALAAQKTAMPPPTASQPANTQSRPHLPQTTPSTPSLGPTVSQALVATSNNNASTTSLGVSDDTRLQYYMRELLLCKNELDFANFARSIVERKVVRQQKQLHELAMTRIRIEYLSEQNRKLMGRLSTLENEHSQAQKMARTRLRDHSAYESTLLDKNREFRQQLRDRELDLVQIKEELTRVLAARDALQEESVKVTMAEEDKQNSLRVIRNEEKAVENWLNIDPEPLPVQGPRAEPKTELDGSVSPVPDTVENYEAKYAAAVMEIEGIRHDHAEELGLRASEIDRLKKLVRDLESRVDAKESGVGRSLAKVAEEIRAADASKLAQLKLAQAEQSARIEELERELIARRLHEEERLSELRAALMLSKPFSLPESDAAEMRIRGRGGAQGTVKR